jgi:hypothetical protein
MKRASLCVKQVGKKTGHTLLFILLTGCLLLTACHRKKIDYSSYNADEQEQYEEEEAGGFSNNGHPRKNKPKHLNKAHTIATDIKYRLKNGTYDRLSSHNVNRLLLFFYDTSTQEYLDLINQLNNSEPITNLVKLGKISVLALFTGEKESDYLNSYDDFPETWINAWDPSGNIKKQHQYPLTRHPSLYLLDRNNVILLNQTDIETLENYLYAN